MSAPLVIYHRDCTDGLVAAWCVAQSYPQGVECVSAQYGDAPPNVEGREVVVVDFSYPRDVIERMRQECDTLLILDHHKSAAADLAGLPYAVFDMSRSGAGLAWDVFHPGRERPWIVDYVEDRDLWRWGLNYSREVNALLGQDIKTIADVTKTLRVYPDPTYVFAFGERILATQRAYVDATVPLAREGVLAGHPALIVNATGYLRSELGEALSACAPFAVIWHQTAQGDYLYSLRSRVGVGADVAEIAQRFGGGGHKNAAGFRTSTLVHSFPGDTSTP